MPPAEKSEVVTSVSTAAGTKPFAATLPSSGVSLEVLKRYSSPKPVRHAPVSKDKKSAAGQSDSE